MHWNVPPDALPGSATFVRVLNRWLNDCCDSKHKCCVSVEFHLSTTDILGFFSCDTDTHIQCHTIHVHAHNTCTCTHNSVTLRPGSSNVADLSSLNMHIYNNSTMLLYNGL